MSIRCFIAIELPEELKRRVSEATHELRSTGADVRWVPAANLHLTLRFLGATPEDSIRALEGMLREAAAVHQAVDTVLEGVGVFPGSGRPRVIWVGLRDAHGLLELQRDVEEGVRGLGWEPEDRPFRAHLTVGRVRSPRGRTALLRAIQGLGDTRFGRFPVQSVSLMKSDLSSSGARYGRLFAAPLGGPEAGGTGRPS